MDSILMCDNSKITMQKDMRAIGIYVSIFCPSTEFASVQMTKPFSRRLRIRGVWICLIIIYTGTKDASYKWGISTPAKNSPSTVPVSPLTPTRSVKYLRGD